jgi:hypothetical protein
MMNSLDVSRFVTLKKLRAILAKNDAVAVVLVLL